MYNTGRTGAGVTSEAWTRARSGADMAEPNSRSTARAEANVGAGARARAGVGVAAVATAEEEATFWSKRRGHS